MTIDDKIRERIVKIQALADRGVDGEKTAASIQLERMIKKYNISEEELSTIKMKKYYFKYKTNLDKRLFVQLILYFFKGQTFKLYQNNHNGKDIEVDMEYLDYVTLSCAYEYFRAHAAKQFQEFCLPYIRRCRTTRTKNAKRAELQEAFFNRYVYESKIYHPEQMQEINFLDMSKKELESYEKLDRITSKVEGGQYHTQVAKETLNIRYDN